MKFSTETITKNDVNKRMFNMTLQALRINLNIPSNVVGTVEQYTEDIKDAEYNEVIGREYITVEINPDTIVFHVLTDMFPWADNVYEHIVKPGQEIDKAYDEMSDAEKFDFIEQGMHEQEVVRPEPRVIGKIDLDKPINCVEEEKLMNDHNLPMNAVLVSISHDYPGELTKCHFEFPDAPEHLNSDCRLFSHEDLTSLLNFQNFEEIVNTSEHPHAIEDALREDFDWKSVEPQNPEPVV